MLTVIAVLLNLFFKNFNFDAVRYSLTAVVLGIIVIAIIVMIIAAVSSPKKTDLPGTTYEPPERFFGRLGEEKAAEIIDGRLKEGDYHLTNVEISFDEKTAEFDNIIVNKYGVFIIEVKNYNGTIVGGEDDYEWKKYHTSEAGNTYVKSVRNPIGQVRRQIKILKNYLGDYGIKVWVSGYAFLLHANSPVENEYILSNKNDIDKAIHTPGKNRLKPHTVESIVKLLS